MHFVYQSTLANGLLFWNIHSFLHKSFSEVWIFCQLLYKTFAIFDWYLLVYYLLLSFLIFLSIYLSAGPTNCPPNGQHNHPERPTATSTNNQHVCRCAHADTANFAGCHSTGGRRAALDVYKRQWPAVHSDTGWPSEEHQFGKYYSCAEYTDYTYCAEYTRWVEILGE